MTMASGYENSPDYGGPEPGWFGIVKLLVFIASAALAAYLLL